MPEVVISSNERLSDDGYYLRFGRPFDFRAGQVIGISTRADMSPRLYSVCSGEEDPEIGILYTVKEGGLLTPTLAAMVAGQRIQVSGPTGSFMQEPGNNVWIATGTGIAPFLSWLRSGMAAPLELIYGARNKEGLFFLDELQERCPGKLSACLSREEAEGMFQGRVTDYLAGAPDLPLGADYYLCGVAEMVVDVRDILIARGIDPSSIHAEIYF